MKKIAIALALSLAATSAFAQVAPGTDVTNLAPAGTTAVAGTSVVIAGVCTATWLVVGGALLLIVVASAGGSSSSTVVVPPASS